MAEYSSSGCPPRVSKRCRNCGNAVFTVYSSQKLAIRRREIRQTLILLPPQTGDRAGPRGQDLYQLACDPGKVIAGLEIEQRRNKTRLRLEGPCGGAHDARHAQGRKPVQRFAIGQQAQILARDLHGLLGESCVLVAEQFDLRAVAGRPLTRWWPRSTRARDTAARPGRRPAWSDPARSTP